MTRRIALLIEYDGTNFVGWQLQPNGRSVQGEMEEAIHHLFGESSRVHGAGRTDSGVHALGQVAHFNIEHTIDLRSLTLAINSEIGTDAAIRAVAEVAPDFDSRRDAIRRHYVYTILHGGSRPALERFTAAWVPQPLDAEAMAAAAQEFLGTHDFSAFRSINCSAKSPRRTIEAVEINASGRRIEFHVTAPSFLMNQVRRMVGTLIEVGRGEMSPDDVARLLNEKGAIPSGPTAPPRGLTLVRVEYEKDPFETTRASESS